MLNGCLLACLSVLNGILCFSSLFTVTAFPQNEFNIALPTTVASVSGEGLSSIENSMQMLLHSLLYLHFEIASLKGNNGLCYFPCSPLHNFTLFYFVSLPPLLLADSVIPFSLYRLEI